MIPTFAVVGHPNKGKSSIVATLAEDERVAISDVPGTTRQARFSTFALDGEPQYVLADTPGFQRARGVLDWLESRAGSASDRPRLVKEFVDAHREDARFRDECELLTPIIEGAGILYVVDGAIIPEAIGHNPSKTIAALGECVAEGIIDRDGKSSFDGTT